MTKKQYIEAIIDNQIVRGIIKESDKEFQIKMRLREKTSVTEWAHRYEAIIK